MSAGNTASKGLGICCVFQPICSSAVVIHVRKKVRLDRDHFVFARSSASQNNRLRKECTASPQIQRSQMELRCCGFPVAMDATHSGALSSRSRMSMKRFCTEIKSPQQQKIELQKALVVSHKGRSLPFSDLFICPIVRSRIYCTLQLHQCLPSSHRPPSLHTSPPSPSHALPPLHTH